MTYYFYKKSIPPKDCVYYDHSKGYAGFKEEQDGLLLFKGTADDFYKYLNETHIPRRCASLTVYN